MKKNTHEMCNKIMLPNGKQPLSAYSDWKPSDGYLGTKRRWGTYVEYALAILTIVACTALLVLLGTR